MSKKNKINIFKIIWVSGIFLLLITTLLMIMDYKINYEHLTKKNLYFYNCNNSICTSQTKNGIQEEIYSTYECGYESCPKINKVLKESYVILNKDNKNILYDFMNNKIISKEYEDYDIINDKYFIVTKNSYKGLIDLNNNILINTEYEFLGYNIEESLMGYNSENIIAKKDNLYGIISIKDGKIIENIKYSEENIQTLLEKIN